MLIEDIDLPNIKAQSASNYTKQVIKVMISKSKTIKINSSSHITHISLREQVPISSLLTSTSFVPDHIIKHIASESKFYVTHEYEYKGRRFRIIMVYDDEHVERKKGVIEDMFKWLTMIIDMGSLAHNCGITTTIYCYLTPFKKELPQKRGEILSYDNANSAVTSSCSSSNEICIFREEEMFKVFIHETFHAFNLDFSLHMKGTHIQQMKTLFKIKSDFNIYETYAESWAEIINIVFLSGDYEIFNKMIQTEIAFSLHQMNTVLNYMGLDYSDIVSANAFHKYKEETNVFCYYVLKSIVLFYWSDFIEFCGGSFKYAKNVDEFTHFIREKYMDSEFMNAVDASKMNTMNMVRKMNTMRMSLWEN